MKDKTPEITELILKAKQLARQETDSEPEPQLCQPMNWPVNCVVGPGLEGAIACETKVGYVNGAKGWLIYRGYDIFDLCAYSTYEEVCYLLLNGKLPNEKELREFKDILNKNRNVTVTQRFLMKFPIERMNTMAALRLGTNLMRQQFSDIDKQDYRDDDNRIISADEDSIPMETVPRGEKEAIYEFKKGPAKPHHTLNSAAGLETSYQLIAGVASIAATIARLRYDHFPLDPDPELSHAANLIYMMTGRKPTDLEERIMDISLILHADHGMNASTFAAMVVASTLSDMYSSVGAGIGALNGPLHGGANEQVLYMLQNIGSADNAANWLKQALVAKQKIMGFGHRVYKAYDPRARVLAPLADYLSKDNSDSRKLFDTAKTLELEVAKSFGKEKKIFPNVDFYSGIVYHAMGIPVEMFTPIFAVSRVIGWTARVIEYLEHNRIFRPRAMYTGPFDLVYPTT